MLFNQLPKVLNAGNPINRNCGLTKGLVEWFKVLHNNIGGRYVLDLTRKYRVGRNGSITASGRRRPAGFGGFSAAASAANVWTGTGSTAITNSPFTVSLWTFMDGGGTVYNRGGSGTRNSIGIRLNSGTQLIFFLYNDDYTATIPSVFSRWSNITVSLNSANTQAIYIDGNKIGTRSAAGAYVGGAGFSLGKNQFDSANLYTGVTDDVVGWNRALTDNEVSAWYKSGITGYKKELNWLDQPWLVSGAAGNNEYVPYYQPTTPQVQSVMAM